MSSQSCKVKFISKYTRGVVWDAYLHIFTEFVCEGSCPTTFFLQLSNLCLNLKNIAMVIDTRHYLNVEQQTSSSLAFCPLFFVMMYFSRSLRVLASTLTYDKQPLVSPAHSLSSNYMCMQHQLTTRAFSPSFRPSSNRIALRVDSGRAYSQNPKADQSGRNTSYSHPHT